MKKEVSKALLERYEEGKCTPEEISQIEVWYNITARENAHTPFKQNMAIQEQARLEQLWPAEKTRRNIFINFYQGYRKFAAAALIVFCSSVGIYLIVAGRKDTTFGGDADPGKNKAIITLSDGTKINVTDAKEGLVSARSGIQITKTGKGEIVFKFLNSTSPVKPGNHTFNTIETPKGGEYKVCLPDGSIVWLNAASTLKFPATFVSGKREVQLSGEAYFEVKKDKIHPFVVESLKQKVQVLGTHFNVNSYPDEQNIKTTLLEGSVLVFPDGQPERPSFLSPNQEAVNNGSSITVQKVDPENAVAWHKGRFSFNEEPLENIMKEISRWYGVTVVYQNNDVRYKTFGGSVSRYSKVSEVLCLLELTKKVRFTIKGKEITVMD
jgi:transmembrane sensor